jgi:hypothetical protein
MLATLGPGTANRWGASGDSHSHQSHLCVRNVTPVTAANKLGLRLRGFRVPAVVLDAPLSVHGCVRLANKLPAARGPATHALSRGLVRSCRPRRRNRAVSHRAASPPRITSTTVMACHASSCSTAAACPLSPHRATISIVLPVP